ncbi:MAG: HD-GYP domain-containing protein [Lachnospiraceae bacterium]|nr:HD-GYP domain-containing protein [Lachnospiraceae bacterium]
MKSVARIELKPGMTTAADVLNEKGEVLIPADKELTEADIARMARHSVMVVTIHEKVDYATTHFEKVRYSEAFTKFEACYQKLFPVYKTLLMNFVLYQMTINMDDLMKVYRNISASAETPELLLDYLYNMLPSEDEMTHAHCLNAALIAGVFGEWLGLSEGDRELFIETGFVYDIGKLRIPDSILWKAGKLDDNERNLLRNHSTMGYDMVKNLPLNPHVHLATLQHHERLDGSGYPNHLKGDQIDPFAKYIAIVDTYEAMTSPRAYRESLIPFQVIAHFEDSNGEQRYDPAALKTILKHIAETQVGLPVRLSDGRTAEVVEINENALSQPIVRLTDHGTLINLHTFGLTIDAIY